MIRKSIRKLRIGLLLALAFVCAALGLLLTRNASVVTFAEEQAAEESALSQKVTPTSEALAYQALGRVNYVNTSACREITTIDERYEGISGKTAVKRDKDNRNYQLFFDKCLEAATTYELSFYVKTLGAGTSFYGDIYYISDSASETHLPVFKKAEGEWVKYSCTFTVNENAEPETVETLFKLTITLKNSFTEAYLDAFSLVRADDGYSPIICGEAFSVADWQAGVDDEGITSFNGEEYPAAYKLSTESLLSKYVATQTCGDFWLRFALQRTAGASVSFSIKSIIGEEIAKVDLTEECAYYEFAITALEGHDYVYVQFDATYADEENDYALIGSFEWVEHVHELGEPSYDASCCTTTTRCSVCEMSLVVVEHNFLVTQPASCHSDGEMVCQNAECGLQVTLPKTGEHVYKDAQGNDVSCSQDNPAYSCIVCGGGRKYFTEHTMCYVAVSDTEHKAVCSTCSYEEAIEEHDVASFVIAINPTSDVSGYAVTTCSKCQAKHGLSLPCIEEGTTAWTKSVVQAETCLETGIVRYTLNAMSDIYVEYVTEALGHDYETIKTMPTCTEEGVSLHHKCKVCGYVKEAEAEIITLEAYGHELSAWIVEIQPTLTSNGLRKRYCSRCEELVHVEEIPHLDEINYTKYALEEPDETKGFYYYYESAEYGIYSVFVEPVNTDNVVIIVICVSCGVVIVGSVIAYCIIAIKAGKSKKKKE